MTTFKSYPGHISAIHKQVQSIECPVCNEKKAITYLARHLKTHYNAHSILENEISTTNNAVSEQFSKEIIRNTEKNGHGNNDYEFLGN